MKWINVNERLPEKNGRYLVCGMFMISIKSFYEGFFYSTRNVMSYMSKKEMDDWFRDAKKCKGVKYWQNLPEEPK